MGKIAKPMKSKKHKKINAIDPFYTGDRKVGIAKDADSVNNAPGNMDQEIPRSLREMMRQKEDAKLSNRKRKKKIREQKFRAATALEKKMTRPLRSIPEFKKKRGESDQAFMNRVEHESQTVIAKSQFEDHYKVNLDKSQNGEIVKKKTASQKKKLTRLNEKKKLKKMKKDNRIQETEYGDFKQLQDEVKFGEIVHQPPTLTAKPRKSENCVDKPGKRSLLLKEIILQNSMPTSSSRKPGEVLKRKNMSMAQQRNLDEARSAAIAQYRQLKKNRESQDIG